MSHRDTETQRTEETDNGNGTDEQARGGRGHSCLKLVGAQ